MFSACGAGPKRNPPMRTRTIANDTDKEVRLPSHLLLAAQALALRAGGLRRGAWGLASNPPYASHSRHGTASSSVSLSPSVRPTRSKFQIENLA